MNKRFISFFIIIVCVLSLLTACGCKHEWIEASCVAPKTCSLCGEAEGDVVAHVWQDATCTKAKTCTVCAIEEGAPTDHSWQDDCLICTVCGLDERSVDEKFMDSLAKGLEARWVLTEANENADTILKSDWEKYFLAEYDNIIEYEDAEFEDVNLGKWAKSYIDSIGASIEVLAYYGTNQWTTKYSNGVYHDRSVALYNIHKIIPVPVSSDNQENLIGILSNGEAISMIRPLLNKVVFEESENSYGWRTYQAVVENTTTLSFSYFSFDVDLIDEDGVTISTETAWVEHWEPGEKIRFEFSTDESFAEMDVAYANWNY